MNNKPIKWNIPQRDQATNPLSRTTNPDEQQAQNINNKPRKWNMPQRDQTTNPRLQHQIKLKYKPHANSLNPDSIQLSISAS